MDKAVIIGINNYKNISGLNGCINDTITYAELLTEYGFKAESIKLIHDDRATKDEIIEKLYWLIDSKPGDRVFLGLSGHGTQCASENGSGEIDGLDEVFCPYDFEWNPKHYISDKTFYQILSKMPSGVLFQWSCDSCHSGDLSRSVARPLAAFAAKSFDKPRFVAPPRDIQWKIDVAKRKNIVSTRESKKLEVGYISGCRSDQTSADTHIDGKYCGAMTHFFVKNLRQNKDKEFETIVLKTREELKLNGYSQEPQAEGSRTHIPFFGKLEGVPAITNNGSEEKPKKKWFFC